MANWSTLDEYSLFLIFSYLDFTEICRSSQVCKHWYFVANDDFLWKIKFCRYFRLKNATLPPSTKSWKLEVKRLIYNVPTGKKFFTEVKSPHSEEITNVCFSSDGKFFASCGRDAHVVLYNAEGKSCF